MIRKKRKVQYDYDRVIYKQRNVVERMFCRFKDWRCIATRFDRNLKNFMGDISLAAAVICRTSVRGTGGGSRFTAPYAVEREPPARAVLPGRERRVGGG